MSAIDDGGPAFPRDAIFDERRGDYDRYASDGMSLRDYFAAKAMSALISTAGAPCLIGALDGAEGELAAGAYKIADAMLAARKVQP